MKAITLLLTLLLLTPGAALAAAGKQPETWSVSRCDIQFNASATVVQFSGTVRRCRGAITPKVSGRLDGASVELQVSEDAIVLNKNANGFEIGSISQEQLLQPLVAVPMTFRGTASDLPKSPGRVLVKGTLNRNGRNYPAQFIARVVEANDTFIELKASESGDFTLNESLNAIPGATVFSGSMQASINFARPR